MLILPEGTKKPGIKWRENLTAEEVMDLDDGPYMRQHASAQSLRDSQHFQKIQTGRAPDSGIGRLSMRIPDTIWARIPQHEVCGANLMRTLCRLWHEYPQFRRRKGGCPTCGR